MRKRTDKAARPRPTFGIDVPFPIDVGPFRYGVWLKQGPLPGGDADDVYRIDHTDRTITVDLRTVARLESLPLFAAAAVARAWKEVGHGQA